MDPDLKLDCSVARALGEIGERWSLLIIREAIMGSSRFDEFHRRLGIARNILQARLSTLVEADVLQRSLSLENARIPIYALTKKGWDIFPVVAALMHWGDRWLDGGEGPPVILVDSATGSEIQQLVLRHTSGEILSPHQIILRPGRGASSRTRRRFGNDT
jgi:DNA-binding HxlR family transcriptional regulator